MTYKTGLTLVAAWVVFLCGIAVAPAMAQINWVTMLNRPTDYVPYERPAFTVASDGSTYFAASRDSGRLIRLVLLDTSGALVWERWLYGTVSAPQVPLVVLTDDSVTIAFIGSPGSTCMARFSRLGEKLADACANASTYAGTGNRLAILPDGDIIVAGGFRSIVRFSPLGQVRWIRNVVGDPLAFLVASGINSHGNYFELELQRFRVWGAVDGELITDVAANIVCCSNFVSRGFEFVSLPDSIIVIESVRGNDATLAKYSNEGLISWQTTVHFSVDSTFLPISLHRDATDGVILAAGGEAARISMGGAVLWQRRYEGAFRLLKIGAELLALQRVDTGAVFTLSAFPIAESNGQPGVVRTYSQTTARSPDLLQGTATGMILNQGSFTALDANLVSRWTYTPTSTAAAHSLTIPCPVRPLQRGTNGDWWARVNDVSFGYDQWSRVIDANGAIRNVGSLAQFQCGFAMAEDGGRVIVDQSSESRARKLSAASEILWNTQGFLMSAGSGGDTPSVAVGSAGDTAYLTFGVHGRVSANGALRYERRSSISSLYALTQFDGIGNAVISGRRDFDYPIGPAVERISPSGELLSSFNYASNCVENGLTLLPDGDVVIADCADVYKIGSDGAVRWKRSVSVPYFDGRINFAALSTDASGNVFVGGCVRNGYPENGGFGAIAIASWDATGVARWQRIERASSSFFQCVSALAPDGSGGAYATVTTASNLFTRGETFLTYFDASGTALWRHVDALSERPARNADIALGADGHLRMLVTEGPSELHPARVTLRKVNPAGLPSSLRLRFLAIPTQPVPYRDAFVVRIGLVSADGGLALATSPTPIRIGIAEGAGLMMGSLGCVVAVGASDCAIRSVRYSALGSGATLWASSDGMPTVTSSSIFFRVSPTSTMISFVGQPPYIAYSKRRVIFAVVGASDAAATVLGSFDGSFSDPSTGLYNCAYSTAEGEPLSVTCDHVIRSATLPFNATFIGAVGLYENSTAPPLSISVQKVTPTIRVEADADNIFVQGEPLLLRVALFVPNGVNVTKFIAAGTLRANGIECAAPIATGTVQDGFAGSFSRCSVVATSSGNFPVSLSFAGSDDLLPTNGGAYAVAISPRAELRGTGSFAAGTQACATSVRTRCTVNDTGNWQCVGPEGMTGQVFFQPPTGSGGHYSASPVQFSNVTSVQSVAGGVAYVASATSCSLDVDGDGSRMGHTDGVLILRRMLGLADAALTVGATHSCAPRSATSIASAINLSAYDIDGDGQARAETDGLLLLRAMLGFRGDALVNGAISTTATRRTAQDIQNFLLSNCSYNLN